jgi:predicted ATPase
LSEVERTVLRRLSVFVTGFTLEAAQQVAEGPGVGAEEVFDAVGGLLMKSLASADTAGSIARYRLLDTTRTYAALKLADAGELGQFRRAHAQYYCALLKMANEADLPTDEWRALVTHLDDIRAALHWAFGRDGDSGIGVNLTSYASSIWLSKALFAECREWTTLAAAVAPGREDGKATNQQIVIHLALASSQLFTTSFSVEAMVAWTKTLEKTVRETQGQLLLRYLASWGSSIRTRYDEALELAQRCAEDAKKLSDVGPTALAEWMLGHSLHHLGRLAEARSHLQHSLDIDTEKARLAQVNAIGYDRRVDTLGNLASTLWMQGFPEQAELLGARVLEAARPLQFAMPLSVAMTWASFHRYLSDTDIDSVEHDIVELIEHARTHSIKPQVGIGNCLLALCQTRRNQFDAAIPLATEGLRLLAEMQYEVFVPLTLAHLSESAIAADRHVDAVSLMAQLASRDRNGEHWCTAEILRVKGLLALSDDDADAAASLFLQSAELARKQGALAWELRAAMNLARLRANQGRQREAIELLEGVYNRFTEGFETVDLLATRSLLSKLAR